MLDDVILALQARGCEPERHGKDWIARCPAHDDETPSLSVAEGDDGKVLVRCFTGCNYRAIRDGLGIEDADFFPPKPDAPHKPPPSKKPKRQLTFVQEWAIRDAMGNIHAYHKRFEDGSGKKVCLWYGADGKTPSKRDTDCVVSPSDLPFYGMHDLPKDGVVVITEGEKDADALRAKGIPAVGTVTGASGVPCDETILSLKGRQIACWPDHDRPGAQHMERVAAAFYRLGGMVAIIDWDAAHPVGAPEEGDGATDFFAKGGTVEQARELIVSAVPWCKPHAKPRVLTQGSHWTPDGPLERGSDVFCREVLGALPPGTIYQRDGQVGRIVGEPGARRFEPLNTEAVRLLVDEHVALEVLVRTENGDAERKFKPCSRDMALLLSEAARESEHVRRLTQITSHPMLLPSGRFTPPGYAEGYFYDEPDRLKTPVTFADRDEALTALYEATEDFPFEEEADRWNFVGLLLTPLIRPAVKNAPIFLICATRPRTGKSLLAETVYGMIVYGAEQPMTPLSDDEDERRKKIFALLSAGQVTVNFDNAAEALDSPALSALVTSSVYTDRVLGASAMRTVPNRSIVVVTGNNLQQSHEIAQRTVPIRLASKLSDPSQRTDFRHPDLHGYLKEHSPRLFFALRYLVETRASTDISVVMGGFGEWASLIGASLSGTHFMSNALAWRKSCQPEQADLEAMISSWAKVYGTVSVTTREVANMVKQSGLFPTCFNRPTELGGLVAFAKNVLNRYKDVRCGDFFLRRQGSGSSSMWHLEDMSKP